MQYLSKEFIHFFQGLEKNNHKEWFGIHKKEYEQYVKQPFQQLVADLIDALPALDPDIRMHPKDAIFRINRDIRFSKDKTPYNLMVKAGFAKGGRKSSYAGYYLAIAADKMHVGGGLYALGKDELTKIRTHIAMHMDEFMKLIENKYFVDTFGHVKGEQIKRIPAEFQEAFGRTSLIANKQFYYMADYEDQRIITGDGLLSFILEHYQKITPINRFLKEAIDERM